jgi:hypothetical protein
MEVEISSGEVYRVGPGSDVLLEDTSGQGHRSWVVSQDAAVISIVQL